MRLKIGDFVRLSGEKPLNIYQIASIRLVESQEKEMAIALIWGVNTQEMGPVDVTNLEKVKPYWTESDNLGFKLTDEVNQNHYKKDEEEEDNVNPEDIA